MVSVKKDSCHSLGKEEMLFDVILTSANLKSHYTEIFQNYKNALILFPAFAHHFCFLNTACFIFKDVLLVSWFLSASVHNITSQIMFENTHNVGHMTHDVLFDIYGRMLVDLCSLVVHISRLSL